MIPLVPIFSKSKEILESLSSLLDEEREAYGHLSSEDILTISERKKPCSMR